jgi:uncharacterized protein (TIGR03086 family)
MSEGDVMTESAPPVDLDPAVRQLKLLLDGLTEDQLSARTPCSEYTIADLLDHVMGLALAFRDAAAKTNADASAGPPEASGGNLPADWRRKLPERLDALANAWADPEAWTGEASAGGVTMPAEVMGVVALDEIVVHSWDLARATGQPFECDPRSAEALFGLLSQSSGEDDQNGLFGTVVHVPADAPLLHRVIGLTGRDPAWTP